MPVAQLSTLGIAASRFVVMSLLKYDPLIGSGSQVSAASVIPRRQASWSAASIADDLLVVAHKNQRVFFYKFFRVHICTSLIAMPNKSPEPTGSGAFSCPRRFSFIHIISCRWLSFLR